MDKEPPDSNLEKNVKRVESNLTCLGHITQVCSHCLADDKNKQCENYQPVYVRAFNVVEAPYSNIL